MENLLLKTLSLSLCKQHIDRNIISNPGNSSGSLHQTLPLVGWL